MIKYWKLYLWEWGQEMDVCCHHSNHHSPSYCSKARQEKKLEEKTKSLISKWHKNVKYPENSTDKLLELVHELGESQY